MEPLDDTDRQTYAWQMDLPGFGEAAQTALKNATVLVARAGGLGGPAAQQLAAAGVGRILIAHGGVVLPSDLNRQILQTHARLGLPRGPSIIERLTALNPRCVVEVLPENPHADNIAAWVARADAVIDACPLFSERFALNDACVALGKPMVEAAVHHWEATITTILPGHGPCLRCWCPEAPEWWTRRFPILGAVSATAGAIAAAEVVKLLTGLGRPLIGHVLRLDLALGETRRLRLRRDPHCPVCAAAVPSPVVGKTAS